MEIPRDRDGNISLELFEMIVRDFSTNRRVIEFRAADKTEESAIRNYLDPNTYVIKSKAIKNGYELKISARN